MNSTPADGVGPCQRITRTGSDGARVVFTAHGGQLLGWTPAGGGPDRLWTSPLATCGPGEAIRGGVPVVFPQFSGRGPLPKHGVVRDRPWQLGPSADPAVAGFVARCTDDEQTRKSWPHGFCTTLTVQAAGAVIELVLEVANTGTGPWTFAAALHTYLATGDAALATLSGVDGLPAEQNAAPGRTSPMPAGPLPAIGPRDVALRDVAAPVLLDDPALGRLVVTAEGFPDRVLWNPGPGQRIPDVPAGAEARFVCVEPAALDPVQLGPGETWRGSMRLTVQD